MKTVFALAIALFACSAQAQDSWTGPDKAQHFIGGAAIGAAVLAATHNETYAFAAGCGAGVLKEVADKYRPGHVASFKDAAVTCAGAFVGLKASGIMLTSRGIVIRRVF